MELILEKLSKTKTNVEFLASMATPAPEETPRARQIKKGAKVLSGV
jgi:hypothetical protein